MAEQTRKLWLYKWHSRGRFHGGRARSWTSVFERPGEYSGYGLASRPGRLLLPKVAPGDLVLAYQTDMRAAIGLCVVLSVDRQSANPHIVFRTQRRFPSPVKLHELKRTNASLRAVAALRQGPVQSFYSLTTSEAHALLIACGVPFAMGADEETPTEFLPETVREPHEYIEGATLSIAVNAYERNHAAREACIAHHGASCAVCGFDFARVYGDIGTGYIHIHHLKPLAEIREDYAVDPVDDLRPVCPNCHAMLHRREPPYSVDEMAHILQRERLRRG